MDLKSWIFICVYPYKSMMVTDIYYRGSVRNNELYDQIPREDRDNHIVAKFINANEETIYVQFSDNLTIYGYSLEKHT